jgi:LemA protein
MKNSTIALLIVGAVILLFGLSVISVQNTAIGYEQNIEQSKSGIQVQLKRQHDLILQLVQVVEQASRYESGTQENIAKLRTAANNVQNGQIAESQALINAVAEAYPQLQANATYVQLMTEMSVSENLVTSYRNTYNDDVKNYQRLVRRFPARMFLSLSGYEVKDYQYLTFSDADTTLPDSLFGQ